MNIGDVAQMAGVSRAAVSRYLNNGYISAEKRERIRKVIEETGYKPSVMAQTLRSKRTRLIGVVIPRINSHSISSVAEGISGVLSEAGYDMLLATTYNSYEKELDFLKIFSNNRVDGVILVATVLTEEHRRILSGMKIPVVVVGQQISTISCIYHDDQGAAYELVQRMIRDGRKEIGYIGVLKEDIAVGRERYEGYCRALREAGLPVRPESAVTADFSVKSGSESMDLLLAKAPDLDAVVCATDRIAVGALLNLKRRGLRIPEEIAIAGFGDNVIARVTTPALTTVHFHYKESGETAAGKILEQLETKKCETAEIRLGYELLIREST